MYIVDLATSIKKYSNDHYVLHHHPHLWLLWQLPLWLQWELLSSRLCTRGDSYREGGHIPQLTTRHKTSSDIQLLKFINFKHVWYVELSGKIHLVACVFTILESESFTRWFFGAWGNKSNVLPFPLVLSAKIFIKTSKVNYPHHL